MARNHVQLLQIILIQVSTSVSRSQGQYWKNNNNAATTSSFSKSFYPSSGYYPSYVYPYHQYPYGGYGQFAYPSQSAATLYQQSSSLTRPQNGLPSSSGLQTQQQYFLGPMNAAQANFLLAYVNSLMHYGNNTIPAPQIPSTPTQNASSIQPTPTVPLSTTTSSTFSEPTPSSTTTALEPFTPSLNESFTLSTSTIIPPEFPTSDVLQSTPSPSVPQINPVLGNNTGETNTSVNQSNITLISPISESSEPILRAAQVQSNPFVANPANRIGNWLYSYNPAVTSFYGNLPPSQPFYPPGYGPWNPFVLTPAPSSLPTLQSNATQQSTPKFSRSEQENSSEAPSTISTLAGEGGLTNMEDLPPQVKEFINMIPDILSMPETSQLSPSNNNAIVHQIVGGLNGAEMGVHQLGGGSAGVTPTPNSYDLKNLQRFKKRHSKSHRRHGN